MRASKDSENTDATYRVAAFQTFLSGRISTFGDSQLEMVSQLTVCVPDTVLLTIGEQFEEGAHESHESLVSENRHLTLFYRLQLFRWQRLVVVAVSAERQPTQGQQFLQRV